MEIKSLKQLAELHDVAVKQEIQTGKEYELSFGSNYRTHSIRKQVWLNAKNKLNYYKEKIFKFGKDGNLVKVTLLVESTTYTFYFINVSKEDVKIYLENIVKLQYQNLSFETIEIKELPLGIQFN